MQTADALSIGEQIKSARESIGGLSQDVLADTVSEFAESCGHPNLNLSQSHISYIERGCPNGMGDIYAQRINLILKYFESRGAEKTNGQSQLNGVEHTPAIPKKVKKSSSDRESDAFSACSQELTSLEPEERARVMAYLHIRFAATNVSP